MAARRPHARCESAACAGVARRAILVVYMVMIYHTQKYSLTTGAFGSHITSTRESRSSAAPSRAPTLARSAWAPSAVRTRTGAARVLISVSASPKAAASSRLFRSETTEPTKMSVGDLSSASATASARSPTPAATTRCDAVVPSCTAIAGVSAGGRRR